jgi:F-type H+-transporting ATPase subunit epsilon
MPASLKVRIIHPEKIVFEGEAEFVAAPGKYGSLGIMAQHTPLYAELVKGMVHVEGPQPQNLDIESGIIKVRNDEVTILIGL